MLRDSQWTLRSATRRLLGFDRRETLYRMGLVNRGGLPITGRLQISRRRKRRQAMEPAYVQLTSLLSLGSGLPMASRNENW